MSVEKNILFYDINYIFVAKGTFWNIKKWYILKEFKVFYIAWHGSKSGKTGVSCHRKHFAGYIYFWKLISVVL